MGPSDDIYNADRLEFFARFGIDPARVRSVKQVHSRRVLIAEEFSSFMTPVMQGPDSYGEVPEARPPVPEADGLVSASRDLVLAVTVADCVPIFLWDRYARGFGVVHSGWKGTGIALDAVRLLEENYGVVPADLKACIGPAIGPCCYEVDAERARVFREEWGEDAALVREGRSYLDLPGTNRRLLEKAGVARVDAADRCTCCSPDLGSYRRQGSTAFSRMIAFIGYLV